jgi:hypothetical protein
MGVVVGAAFQIGVIRRGPLPQVVGRVSQVDGFGHVHESGVEDDHRGVSRPGSCRESPRNPALFSQDDAGQPRAISRCQADSPAGLRAKNPMTGTTLASWPAWATGLGASTIGGDLD